MMVSPIRTRSLKFDFTENLKFSAGSKDGHQSQEGFRVTLLTFTSAACNLLFFFELVSIVTQNEARNIRESRLKIVLSVQKGFWIKNRIDTIKSNTKVFD